MFKKVFFLSFMTVGVLMGQQAAVEDYSTGRSKIVTIMSDDRMGVSAYNRDHVKVAETQNLAADLNATEIARFFGCQMVMGETHLIETLQHLVSKFDDEAVLSRRTAIIHALKEDPKFRKAVKELLEIAKEAEPDVIVLMSDIFKGRTCPELAGLELLKQQNPALYPVINFFHSNSTARTAGTIWNLASWGLLAFATQFFARQAYTLARAGIDYSEAVKGTLYTGVAAALSSYGNYKDYTSAAEKRRKLHALNRMVYAAEKIEALYDEYGLKSQFKVSAIEGTGKTIIKKLKHPRYEHKRTYVFMLPSVHTFLYELYQNEAHLAQLFACIAEMDAYYSIAQKMVDSEGTANPFCFVKFTADEKAGIVSEGFWNVLVKNAVPSNVDESKHIILTGPNAGGKTTTIRALLQNIMLAQTFGIAAAQSCTMPMFDIVHSYLNISDDILAGKSLFASEVKRAQDVLLRIKELAPGERYFFALDELFTGTAAEAGEECAYEFIKRISEFPGVQFIYATHFNKLKELGNESIMCANYKVDAPIKNEEGKLVYPFTLSKGANEVNVALDLAKEAELFA